MAGKKFVSLCQFKSLRRDNTGIPTLYNNGTAYSRNEAKANALNQYFATVFVQDDNTTLPDKLKAKARILTYPYLQQMLMM